MKDNRKIFEYLIQNTDAPIQTKALPILQGGVDSSLDAARLNQSKISDMDDPNVQFIIKQKKLVNGKIVITEQNAAIRSMLDESFKLSKGGFMQMKANDMEQTGPLENLSEMLQSVTSNQMLHMILSQTQGAAIESEPLR